MLDKYLLNVSNIGYPCFLSLISKHLNIKCVPASLLIGDCIYTQFLLNSVLYPIHIGSDLRDE